MLPSELISKLTGAPAEAPPSLRDEINRRRFNLLNEIPRPEPVYWLGDVPICTRGNLTTVISAPKTGKTAFLRAMQASVLGAETGGDYLGIKSSNPTGLALIHIDTEMSPYDHHEGSRRALRRARVSDAPDWFYSYGLTGFSALDLVASLKIILADTAVECGGVHSVFIDGLADFTVDVNDPPESNAIVSLIQSFAIQYDCSIICVIHKNPLGEKGRGHLGSNLERKSETNLDLQKTGDATLIWSDRNRGAPIPKERGHWFCWSPEERMHVTGEAPSVERTAGPTRTKLSLDDVVQAVRAGARSTGAIIRSLEGKAGARSVEHCISEAVDRGLILKVGRGVYSLPREILELVVLPTRAHDEGNL
jgi:AAA domain